MSDYEYRPRFGFDIRVRPPEPRGETPRYASVAERICEAPDCGRRAAVRAPTDPRRPGAKTWLCLAHAQEHNRNWNFFAGLSEKDAAAARHASAYGDRPTWTMNRNARASVHARGPSHLFDTFGLFGDTARRAPNQARMREGRVLPKLQAQAFQTLGLRTSAAAPDIRRRYAELVRRFHPDANGGDRSTETQLAEVVKAHQVLKKAGIC
jgi:hypothetical protein